jgi:hypothetical protein
LYISGLLPLEAEIHIKVFTMFGNITRAHKNSTEWKLAERQLHTKSLEGNSWFMEIKKLCIKYELLSLVGIMLISFWLTVFVLASGWIFPISYVGETVRGISG